MGGGWALEFESFLGPAKWHRADRRVPFGAPKNALKPDVLKPDVLKPDVVVEL